MKKESSRNVEVELINPFSWLNYTRGRKVTKPPATQTNPHIKQAFYAGICHLSLELQRLRVFVADFNSPASLTDPLIYLHQGKYTSAQGLRRVVYGY